MLIKKYHEVLEEGSYLEEKNNTFILHETEGDENDFDFFNGLEPKVVKNKILIPQENELFKVNFYCPKVKIEHNANIEGIYIYVPPKRCINVRDKNGEFYDKFPTVIKIKNSLVFCAFNDLYNILYKITEINFYNGDLSSVFESGLTTIQKNFYSLRSEKNINVELNIYNKCKDPDLMKRVTPWIFVPELIEECLCDKIDDDDLFWGVVENKGKYYIPFFVWKKCYAVELIDCYPTEIEDNKLPTNVHRILLPKENESAMGIAYRRKGQMYEIRVWIKVEEYIRNFYNNSEEVVVSEEEIEGCISRHLSILREEGKPLYYQVEKIVPPFIFKHNLKKIVEKCKQFLAEIVKLELRKNLYGV